MLVIGAFSVIGGVTGIALFSILGMVAMLGLLLPGICAAIRRLHDHDKSGWWIFITLIPLIGAVLMLYWFATRGTVGPNQFGADPLA
ncbi:UNVERIFIED_CONTAM: hypothetical protein GTU68_018777 [Idotea baltica]|nr:hypothetical protein [Idotea baltica]